jgi:hypothetical protein
LYYGALELTKPSGRQRKRSIDARNIPQANQLPIVKIGRPRAWAVDELLFGEDWPAEVKASIKDRLFFVARLACSFRPQNDNVSLVWAQLALQLKPDHQGHAPLAYDMFPMLVEHEQKCKRIALTPSLKFSYAEAGSGKFAYSTEYPAIEPLLTASGLHESTPSWNFTAVPGFPLTGTKLLYVVVAAPRALTHLTVTLTLSADLDYRQQRFSAWLHGDPNKAHPLISDVQLWP